MQTPENTKRKPVTTGGPLWIEPLISTAVIDPSQPHTFSPHLRFKAREDETFVLEFRTLMDEPNPCFDGPQEVWQEVALWREPEKSNT